MQKHHVEKRHVERNASQPPASVSGKMYTSSRQEQRTQGKEKGPKNKDQPHVHDTTQRRKALTRQTKKRERDQKIHQRANHGAIEKTRMKKENKTKTSDRKITPHQGEREKERRDQRSRPLSSRCQKKKGKI
jgi:hypothetical protein